MRHKERIRPLPVLLALPDDALLSAGEVALLYRVDPKTVTRWAAAGKIPHMRTPGRHTRFHNGTIKELLR